MSYPKSDSRELIQTVYQIKITLNDVEPPIWNLSQCVWDKDTKNLFLYHFDTPPFWSE